jgi:hypothetical protein
VQLISRLLGVFQGEYMAAKIKITPKDNMVIVQISGRTTLQDFYDIIKEISDGKRHLYNRRLYDLRKCQLDISREELITLAEKTKPLDQGPAKVALLAGSELSYGLSRMFEVLRDQNHTEIYVFRDEGKAMEWLL